MRNLRIFSIIILFTSIATTITAQEAENPWSSSRPDGHAPIGVMGDHRHGKGEWMLSYRFMPMWMKDNLKGSDKISNEEIFQNYMVAPQKMNMQMHMLGVMYAPSDKLTLMAMGNFIKNDMDLQTRMGMVFSTKSSGFGDVKVSALYGLFNKNRQTMHLNLGVSIPTGSITEKGDTPAGENMQLPYPMQIGSGTWDIMPGLTYLGETDKISWGVQALGTLRLGENARGYAFGNQLNLTGWVAYQLSDWWSTSFRLNGSSTGKIEGTDEMLNPMMVTTADTNNFGGESLLGYLGVNFYVREGVLKGHRLAVEYGLPFYQNLNGPQMAMQSMLMVGWQLAF